MRVVVLAGGMGTRLQEETSVRPKPMVEIGGMPILWHIMKHYRRHGLREFLVACGYMGSYIKSFFLDRFQLCGDLSIDFAAETVVRHQAVVEDWIVHLIDTGAQSMTGGRIGRLAPRLESGTFMATYGDGVSNVDLNALLQFHRGRGKTATVTAVRPPARFGGLVLDGDQVSTFTEKPSAGEGWINGGFLVFEPRILDYLCDDSSSLEEDVLPRLARERQLAAYRHSGFWQCMDTLRDKQYLESLWKGGAAPWKTWERPD